MISNQLFTCRLLLNDPSANWFERIIVFYNDVICCQFFFEEKMRVKIARELDIQLDMCI